ncbi:MAG: hydantoinase B/oxoprolinase family protein [Pseudomonadota bacterium]
MDGVQLALLDSRLNGVARKMANTLLRTGRSGILAIARDFSCCILTAEDELLAFAESLPVHILSGPDVMARTMRENHPVLARGDAFLHNSPYHGCTHPADHSILIPVIDDDGVHRFTVLAKAHQADCGNALPTTYMGTAIDVYAEGALIFPAVRVQQNYEHNMDIVRMCQMRIRVPRQWWGDYLATLGAARVGERELLSLGREVGWGTLQAFAGAWFDYSERRMEAAIQELPRGRATRTSIHDPVPGTPEDGVPITVSVDIDPAGGRIGIDLTDNPDCMPCGLNLSEACSRSAALLGVFNSIDHSIPKNAGSYRRIDVALRENCICGIPKHPISCSVATTNIADRVANPIQAAIAEIKEGLGLAEAGLVMPPSIGVISGHDPRSGEAYVNEVYLGITGGAATPTTDGWLSIVHAGNAGMCYQDSIELDELRQPIFVESRKLLPDTEGAGRTRGALSAYAAFGPTMAPMCVAYVSDGNLHPAAGTRGGGPGGRSWQRKRLSDGAEIDLPNCAEIWLEPGEMIVSASCGGGGYGDPKTRPPEQVLHDVNEGWVSVERARAIYGVAINADGTLDQAATTELRKSPAVVGLAAPST